MADRWRDQERSGILLLATRTDGKVDLLTAVTPDLVAKGVRAGEILKTMADVVGGRGGGRPDLAQGGGRRADRAEAALEAGEAAARSRIAGEAGP